MGASLSILHRITGALLSVGLLILAFFWVALASGRAAFEAAMRILGGPAGIIALVGLSFCFWYHLLNGIRHLFWDAGRGFERAERHLSGWVAVIGALLLTLALWFTVGHRL
jgi:succinate dehydrogenase / fumarate reductase cytochrome b subunit